VHCLCCSGPAWASDVVILDTPRGDLVEISSSSYGLSLFSSKTGSRHDEGARAAPSSYGLSLFSSKTGSHHDEGAGVRLGGPRA
jgi:hypothetical protein